VKQVPCGFHTWFLPFYITYATRCTCRLASLTSETSFQLDNKFSARTMSKLGEIKPNFKSIIVDVFIANEKQPMERILQLLELFWMQLLLRVLLTQ